MAVIIGPILVILMSRVFGAGLGTRVALGRPLTRPERRAVFAEECRFLVIGIPPLVVLSALTSRRYLVLKEHRGDRAGRLALARLVGLAWPGAAPG